MCTCSILLQPPRLQLATMFSCHDGLLSIWSCKSKQTLSSTSCLDHGILSQQHTGAQNHACNCSNSGHPVFFTSPHLKIKPRYYYFLSHPCFKFCFISPRGWFCVTYTSSLIFWNFAYVLRWIIPIPFCVFNLAFLCCPLTVWFMCFSLWHRTLPPLCFWGWLPSVLKAMVHLVCS